MTEAVEKTTVPNPSAATDGEQPLHKESTSSITEWTEKCKEEDTEDIFVRIRRNNTVKGCGCSLSGTGAIHTSLM